MSHAGSIASLRNEHLVYLSIRNLGGGGIRGGATVWQTEKERGALKPTCPE